jgi:hypothetical protein
MLKIKISIPTTVSSRAEKCFAACECRIVPHRGKWRGKTTILALSAITPPRDGGEGTSLNLSPDRIVKWVFPGPGGKTGIQGFLRGG